MAEKTEKTVTTLVLSPSEYGLVVHGLDNLSILADARGNRELEIEIANLLADLGEESE